MAMLRTVKLMAFTAVALLIVVGAEAGQVLAESFAVAEEDRMLALVNDHREARGIEPLETDDALRMVARRHTREMVRTGELHHNPDLRSAVNGARPGWTLIGENVGVGPTTQAVHDGFMDSPRHRRNLEDVRFTVVGVAALASADGRTFYTQTFAELPPDISPRAPRPSPSATPTPGDVVEALVDVLNAIANGVTFWR